MMNRTIIPFFILLVISISCSSEGIGIMPNFIHEVSMGMSIHSFALANNRLFFSQEKLEAKISNDFYEEIVEYKISEKNATVIYKPDKKKGASISIESIYVNDEYLAWVEAMIINHGDLEITTSIKCLNLKTYSLSLIHTFEPIISQTSSLYLPNISLINNIIAFDSNISFGDYASEDANEKSKRIYIYNIDTKAIINKLEIENESDSSSFPIFKNSEELVYIYTTNTNSNLRTFNILTNKYSELILSNFIYSLCLYGENIIAGYSIKRISNEHTFPVGIIGKEGNIIKILPTNKPLLSVVGKNPSMFGEILTWSRFVNINKAGIHQNNIIPYYNIKSNIFKSYSLEESDKLVRVVANRYGIAWLAYSIDPSGNYHFYVQGYNR